MYYLLNNFLTLGVTMAQSDVNTQIELELLKKEIADMKQIHVRLDTAIEKITDFSNCINRLLAVHEEKITQQEESQQRSVQEFTSDIKELHSRITTNTKELTALMTQQHKEQKDVIDRLKDEVSSRVGVLEKWRWIIIGGSIVLGFIIQKLPVWG
jgi:predicted transcriptional regulator